MTSRSSHTWNSLFLLWLCGLLLAIGSKAYDPEEREAVDPVLVDFVVTGDGSMTLNNGDTLDTVSNLMVSGSFEKGGDAAITLREVPVTLDTLTSFDLDVSPFDGSNELAGNVAVNVSQALEFELERVPTSGQITLLRDGTTTLVTFDGDTNNVVLDAGSAASVILSFDNIRGDFSDEDLTLDRRIVSKAYRTLETIWLTTRFSETAQVTVSDNLDMLESMGRGSPLSLTCDNAAGSTSPSYTLTWTLDSAGTGIDSPGNGDSFEFSWLNCLFNSDDRYVQSDFSLVNYQLENDVEPRNMSYSAVLTPTLFSEQTIDSSTPSLTNTRINGTLDVSATEGDTVVSQN